MKELCVAFVVLGLTACGGANYRPAPVAAVPVSFDINLETARECQYRGAVEDLEEVQELDANLVVVIVYTAHSSSYNGATAKWSTFKGKAVKCPPDVLKRIVASAARDQTGGGL